MTPHGILERAARRTSSTRCACCGARPASPLVAVLTLALGIGANSAIFSVVHGVLLQSLPYSDADRLYRVRTLYPDGTPYSLSAPDFASVRQDATAIRSRRGATRSRCTRCSAPASRARSTAPASPTGCSRCSACRTAPDAASRGTNIGRAATTSSMLDHGFWQRQFGGDAALLGRTLSLGGRPYTVVGVLAAGREAAAQRGSLRADRLRRRRSMPTTARISAGASSSR